MEERFCERVKMMGCTCITISHRPALVAFHDLVLALDGEGGWAVHRGANASDTTDEHQVSGQSTTHCSALDSISCHRNWVPSPQHAQILTLLDDLSPHRLVGVWAQN